MKKNIFLLFILILSLCHFNASAQELEIQLFQVKPTDLTARTRQVKDNNKVPCALIKVAIAGNDASFSGNVGTPDKVNGEYLVYVPANTKRLQVSRPDYLPVVVVFENYGITIESLTTYELRINSPALSNANFVTAHISSTPANAELFLDDEYIGDTPLKFEASAGNHTIRLSMDGYEDLVQDVALKLSDKNRFTYLLEKQKEVSATDGTIDLSASGAANCYVAQPGNIYSFDALLKGNTSLKIGTPNSVAVIWETFNTNITPKKGEVITDVTFTNGRVSFRAENEGNALVAVMDSGGEILWSWHIWVTGADLESNAQTYPGGIVMMDRNLGALSATPGDNRALGLLYQWGRKDPFIANASYIKEYGSEPANVSSNATTGTETYAIKHPSTFITNTVKNSDWLNSGDGNLFWNSIKGIYDPCPAGWRVPDGGNDGIWTQAGLLKEPFDNTNKGMSFKNSFWYPAAGQKNNASGRLNNIGSHGYYWSCTNNASHTAYLLYFNNGGVIEVQHSEGHSFGLSVRCQKE